MNTTMMLMMAIPFIGAGLLYYFNRETQYGIWLLPMAIIPGMLIVALGFLASFGAVVADTEIISGKVTGKTRHQDTYVESYSCNPHSVRSGTDSKGNATYTTEYDTCYRDHWTTEWTVASTVGSFQIDKIDRTNSSAWSVPDPQKYVVTVIGEPASRKHIYQNYIQAVPNSLFAAVNGSTMAKFAGKLPEYPLEIYDTWKINRVVQVGVSLPDVAMWNQDISNMLRELGPQRQANVIVVIVKETDPNYAEALRDHWEGVNKNDVVLVMGTEDGQTIAWNKVISWTKNELFKIELQDRVSDLNAFDRVKIMNIIETQVAKNFERRRMREFEYLKGEIDPPNWVIILISVLLIAMYAVGTVRISRNAYPIRRFR